MIFVIVSVIGAGKSKSVDHFIFCVRRNASRSLLVHSNQPADQPTSQPASQPTSLPTPMIDCTWWERVLEHVPVCPCLFEVSVPTSTRARALVSSVLDCESACATHFCLGVCPCLVLLCFWLLLLLLFLFLRCVFLRVLCSCLWRVSVCGSLVGWVDEVS